MKYPPISSTVVPALDNTTPMAIFALQDMPLEQSALASVDATLGVSVDTEVERVTEEATDVAVLVTSVGRVDVVVVDNGDCEKENLPS